MTSTIICWPCFGAVLVTCPPASQCVTGDSKKHAGWSGKWRKQINTHSVSLHSWKSRGSRESTSALTFKIEKMLLRHTPYVSFSLRVLVLENISYLWAGGSSVSGLARSAVVTLRVGKREATVAKYIIEVFTKLVNQKCWLKSACGNTSVYVHPLQLCQVVQGGRWDPCGPWEGEKTFVIIKTEILGWSITWMRNDLKAVLEPWSFKERRVFWRLILQSVQTLRARRGVQLVPELPVEWQEAVINTIESSMHCSNTRLKLN